MAPSSSNLALLPEASPLALAEKIIAYANGSGGTVVIGYDERGRLLRHFPPDELESMLREAVGLTQPLVPASIEATDSTQGGPSHVIVVPRSREHHQLRASVPANAQTPVAFEDETMPGATLADFDTDVVAEFIARRETRTRRKQPEDASVVLREVGALDAASRPTVAGTLLFARNPGMFVKSSGVVFVKFPGVEMRAEGGAMGYGRREEINGPLARVVERTWKVVFEEMRVGAIVKGRDREDVLEYPEIAVREALVNAICHRDYSLHGRRIEIRKFSDRLEILSPGGLAGYMTLDNLIEEHYSRNPRIVQGLYQWGYIEELGLGIDRMLEEMTGAGHPPPRFEDKGHSFKVTLSNHRERRTNLHISPAANLAPPNISITERQARALAYVRDHGRITNSDYQTLCPNVSAETLRSDLADLVSKSALIRVGEKKGTYYIAK